MEHTRWHRANELLHPAITADASVALSEGRRRWRGEGLAGEEVDWVPVAGGLAALE